MRYSKQLKNEAFGYFAKGLNSKEIGKLLDLNFRTVQEWMQADNWKEQRNDLRLKEEKRIIRKYRKQQRQMAAQKAKKMAKLAEKDGDG